MKDNTPVPPDRQVAAAPVPWFAASNRLRALVAMWIDHLPAPTREFEDVKAMRLASEAVYTTDPAPLSLAIRTTLANHTVGDGMQFLEEKIKTILRG